MPPVNRLLLLKTKLKPLLLSDMYLPSTYFQYLPFDYSSRNQLLLYSARRLMGSRLIESPAYCNQILLAQLYINNTQNTSVN
jgi:hypothetical protein